MLLVINDQIVDFILVYVNLKIDNFIYFINKWKQNSKNIKTRSITCSKRSNLILLPWPYHTLPFYFIYSNKQKKPNLIIRIQRKFNKSEQFLYGIFIRFGILWPERQIWIFFCIFIEIFIKLLKIVFFSLNF